MKEKKIKKGHAIRPREDKVVMLAATRAAPATGPKEDNFATQAAMAVAGRAVTKRVSDRATRGAILCVFPVVIRLATLVATIIVTYATPVATVGVLLVTLNEEVPVVMQVATYAGPQPNRPRPRLQRVTPPRHRWHLRACLL